MMGKRAKDPTRSFLVAEDLTHEGKPSWRSLAIVWSTDAAGALGLVIGEEQTVLHSLRYWHGGSSTLTADARVGGRERAFLVLAAPDVLVPLHLASPLVQACVRASG